MLVVTLVGVVTVPPPSRKGCVVNSHLADPSSNGVPLAPSLTRVSPFPNFSALNDCYTYYTFNSLGEATVVAEMTIGKEAATSTTSVIKGETEEGEGRAVTAVGGGKGALAAAVEDGEQPREFGVVLPAHSLLRTAGPRCQENVLVVVASCSALARIA